MIVNSINNELHLYEKLIFQSTLWSDERAACSSKLPSCTACCRALWAANSIVWHAEDQCPRTCACIGCDTAHGAQINTIFQKRWDEWKICVAKQHRTNNHAVNEDVRSTYPEKHRFMIPETNTFYALAAPLSSSFDQRTISTETATHSETSRYAEHFIESNAIADNVRILPDPAYRKLLEVRILPDPAYRKLLELMRTISDQVVRGNVPELCVYVTSRGGALKLSRLRHGAIATKRWPHNKAPLRPTAEALANQRAQTERDPQLRGKTPKWGKSGSVKQQRSSHLQLASACGAVVCSARSSGTRVRPEWEEGALPERFRLLGGCDI